MALTFLFVVSPQSGNIFASLQIHVLILSLRLLSTSLCTTLRVSSLALPTPLPDVRIVAVVVAGTSLSIVGGALARGRGKTRQLPDVVVLLLLLLLILDMPI